MYGLRTESCFDAAHFLTDYHGKCENLHGHRWRVVAYLRQKELQKEGTCKDMVVDFGDFKKSDKFKEGLSIANEMEEAADDIFVEVAHGLFTKESDHPMRAMVWMEIFSRMERATDRCMEVADTMSSIVLKNS